MTTDRNVEFYQGRAWIEIDRAALKHNVGVLRSRLPEGCVLMPAIKANAYGHGSNEIAICLLYTSDAADEYLFV